MKTIRILLTALLFSTVLFSACSDQHQKQTQVKAQTGTIYTCPMHPQISEDHPGSCPICGMTLVKKTGQATESSGISLNTVLQPVNSAVISTITAVVPLQKEISTKIDADGYLDFDTRTFNNIAARFSGRIEKLYLKYAFQEIHLGQRIFDIYSPDMVTAQQDLIYVNTHSPQETALINSARQKLSLLGMTDAQINLVIKTKKPFYSLPVYSPYSGHIHDAPHSQMAGPAEAKPSTDYANNLPLSIKEGMYVTKGQVLFNVVNPHHLWAVVKIDQSAIAGLKLGQPVKLTIPDLPGKSIYSKVNFIEPFLKEGEKTAGIRVYLDNMDHRLMVNSVIKTQITTGTVKGLWIPRSALLNLGRKRVVWLKQGPSYRVHQVNAGALTDTEVQITRGLSVTDSLASNAQYLTDSESFVKIQKP